MTKISEKSVREFLSSNSLVARLVNAEDLQGLPGNKVDVYLDSDMTFKAFTIVPVLPRVEDAVQGVFYITEDGTLNYVQDGEWKSISGGGGGGTVADYSIVDTDTGWEFRKNGNVLYTYTNPDLSGLASKEEVASLGESLEEQKVIIERIPTRISSGLESSVETASDSVSIKAIVVDTTTGDSEESVVVIPIATTTTAGVMSAADKAKLDDIEQMQLNIFNNLWENS